MNLLFRKKSAYILLSIMNATMLLLFLPTSVHATPVSHPGQIKISVFDELRQPVQNADIGVSCGNSSPVDTGIPTDYSGTEYIDPATLLGASCVSGDPIIIQVASSTLVTQTYPVINAASNYYSDIDPDSALTYHDGSNNVYSFGVETTGQYDASFWNMSDDPLGLSFPTGTPDAVVPNYSGTPLLNFDWSGSSPTGGISGYDWDAEFTKTVTTGEGMYEFDAGVDDGIRVYIDDTPLTPDGWTTQGIGTLYSWKTHLTAGSHTIKVDYFQGGGGSALKTAFYPIFPASPVLSVVKPIISPLDDAFSSPIITINASVAGNITSSGSCSYSGSVNSGNTDIPLSLSPLDGDHSDCTLTLTDPSTDLSNTISVPSFTAASGYQTHYISSCQDLENVGNNPNTYLDQITLTNSIDCTGIDFAPLSFGGNAFQGFFDGGYNTISNLSINQPGIDGVGLFSATNAALMGNVTITGSGVAGRNEVGAFVGYARNTNFVSVSSTMAVSNGTGSGSWGVGGLVGYLNYDDGLNHNLNHLYVSGTVTSTASTIGGIAGEMDVTYAGTNVLVQSVTSTAVIGSADFPSSESGGLFGDVWSINTSDAASTTLTIDHAYASGDVFGGGGGWSNTGGLVGLFESVTNGGPLAISVTSSTAAGNVTSNNGYAGGFIGDNVIYYADHDFQQTFDGDLATGSVVGDAFSRYVGGFLGFVNMNNDAGVHQELLIKNSVASGSTVQGYLYVGGFVGGDDGDSGQVRLNYDYSSGGLIFQNDYSSANVTHAVDSSNNYFGGFAGILNGNASDSIQYPAAIAVDQCAAVGSVTAENSAAVGGFVGEIDGNVAITNSYSTGDTVGAVYTGGFVGVLGAVNPGSLVPDGIAASYSTGAVTSTSDYAGGFAGYLITSEMIGDYAVSHVSTPGDNHGGLMGGISGGIPPAYDVYDQARTGQIELMAGAGVDAPMFGLMAVNGDGTGSNPVPDDAYFFNSTSTEPYDFHDYFPADYWNFDTVWNVHRNTYPTLKNLPYALIQGNGSEQSPYQIRSCEDLQTMSNQDPSSYFQLQNDIDCTGIDFQPNDFGDASFTGSLDGQGYSIINLNVNQSYSDAGLFRFVADATIHDIVFDGGSIQSYNNAGVIAGSALDTNIFNVTSTASVISNDDGSYFGGLVGTATFSNGLANNWSGLTVSSTLGAGAIAGGLAGYLEVLDAGTTFAVNSSTFSGNINYSIDNLYDAGGLIGLTYVHNAEGGATTTLRIANSSASSTINTGNGGAAGEIIGEIWMNIDGENQIGPVDVQMTSSTASGQVSGQYTVGGFIGGAEAEGNADAILNISHNTANVAVNSNGSSAGGFVGFTLMQSSYPHNIQLNFTDDVAEGDVVGNFQVGGFLGSAIGMGPAIDLFDPNATGGLTISRSYASGNVSGTSDEVGGFAGGLAGYSVNPSVLQTITIDQCYARGSVLGGGVNTGGFVGVQYGATGISNAAALGNVSGNLNYTGGFVGDIGGADTSIRNSYAIGSVFGAPGGAVGGFAGLLESLGSISNSFSVGAVTADAGGGFIGSDTADESALSNDYFDIYNSLESSCLPSGGGATECTGVDNGGSDQSYFYLNSNAPFLNGSPVWDFTSIWEKHVAAYPTLRAVPFGLIGNSGLISGSANNPTIISSCTDLQNVSTGNYAGTYELGADIDCTGVDFQPIQFGPFGFQGVFNGQGHSISNLTINQDGQNVGLFSFLDGGIIENVSILSGSVTGTSYVGGLVGIAYDSIIQNVTSTIPVSGAGYAESIGGIVGATYFDDGQSYDWSHLIASSTVAGYNVTGGLAGTIDINYPGTAFHLDTATSTSVLTSTVDEINQSGGMIGILSADNIFGATSTVQITNSYSLITVSSTYGFLVGGFVGDVRANESGPYGEGPTEITISSSTAQGIMNSASYSYGWGGFVGAAETGGSSDSSITLSHDSATTNVNGVYSVGGFAGVGWVLNWNGPYHMEVNMTDDYATGAVSGIDFVGGFFGSTEGEGSFAYLSNELATGGLSIARSYSSGPVTGTGNEVGGFAGYVDCYSGNNAILHVCRFIQDFSTSPVVGTGYDIGGFVGNLAGFSSVEDSYETGDVSELSGKHVGGFVGQMGINSGNNSITRSYSTGSVTGSADINGGFVGQIAQDGAVIQNNFSAGAVNSGGGFIGGAYNVDLSLVQNNYFDVTRAGLSNCALDGSVDSSNCAGVNVDGADSNYFFNNTSNAPFSGAGSNWDFSGTWQAQTFTYPLLKTIPLAAQEAGAMIGSGTQDDPYLVSNCAQLQNIENDVFSAYKLVNDIDCSATAEWNNGLGFFPIGDLSYGPPFLGFFDGNHHTITNLHINSSNGTDVGLFSFATASVIQNVTLDGGSVSSGFSGSSYSLPPGIAGLVGFVSNAVVRGASVKNMSINAALPAGGVVGNLSSSGPAFDNMYYQNELSFSDSINNTISSSGFNLAGGLVGSASSVGIDNSFASSTVNGDFAAGGLVGMANNIYVRNSYATGNITSTQSTNDVYTEPGLGGIIGSAAWTVVASSFSTAQLINNGSTPPGGIIGSIYAPYEVADSFYDISAANVSTCTGNYDGGALNCVGVNADGMDPDHFKNTVEVSPLNMVGGSNPFADSVPQWDFTKVWAVSSTYPQLLSFVAPPMMPENFGISGDYNTTTTISWSAPSSTSEGTITGYYAEVGVDGENWNPVTASSTVGASTFSTQFPSGTFASGVTYVVHVYAMQDGPENTPIYSLPLVGHLVTSSGVPPVVSIDSIENQSTFSYRPDRLTVISDSTSTISFSGGCSSVENAINAGTSVVTLHPMAAGTYDCSILVTSDATGLTTSVSIPEIVVADPPVVSIEDCNDLQHLVELRQTEYGGDTNAVFKLSNNIDCTGVDFHPVDFEEQGLSTLFDGQGYSITNLNIYQPQMQNVGLVRYANNAFFKDLTLSGGNVVGQSNVGALSGLGENVVFENVTSTVSVGSSLTQTSGQSIGGLVGNLLANNGYSTLTNVNVSGGVFGGLDIGGLVGNALIYDQSGPYQSGITINNSEMSGAVQSDYACAGGMVGWASNLSGGESGMLTIQNSHSVGNVSAYYPAGGLVGCGSSMKISDSYATGNISGFWEIGGLVGELDNSGYIQRSFATGNVTMPTHTYYDNSNGDFGGLVGYMDAYAYAMGGSPAPAISSSYATGSVGLTGSNYVGGLVGAIYSGGNIHNSFATGNVTGEFVVGGLVGEYQNSGSGATSTIQNSYAAPSSVSGVSRSGDNAQSIGGLVGRMDAGNIQNSFAADLVQSDGTAPGGLVGYLTADRGISGSNNLFDANRADLTNCVGQGSNDVGCDYVNLGGDNSNYFYSLANAPMSSWSHDIWTSDSYPTLLGLPSVLSESVDQTPPGPVTNVSASVVNDTILQLLWNPPTDGDYSSTIIRDYWYSFGDENPYGTPFSVYDGDLMTMMSTSTSFMKGDIPDGVYGLGIFAVDTHGNASLAATSTYTLWRYPIFTSRYSTNFQQSSVSVGVRVTTPDGSPITSVKVKYSQDWRYDHEMVNDHPDGSGDYPFTIGGLLCNTYYHTEWEVTNKNGTATSGNQDILTAACGAISVSSVSATPSTSTAEITWTSDRVGTSQVAYSPDTAHVLYSNTVETDEDTRVSSHTVVLTNLKSCTTYHYQVISIDEDSNTSTSDYQSFDTTGCIGGTAPSSATSALVSTTDVSTSSLTDSDNTFTVTAPANFTAATSSVVIQIKALSSTSVLGTIGTPASDLKSGAVVDFDVKALIDSNTTLDSFDLPVTITYNYSANDISGLNESSLWMYHYHNDTWMPLDNCSLDTHAKTITCTAPSFSIFAVFGKNPPAPAPPQNNGGGGGGSGGVSPYVGCMDKTALNYNPAAIVSRDCMYAPKPVVVVTPPAPVINPNALSCTIPLYLKSAVRYGAKNNPDDVKMLQKFLNTDEGYNLPISGVYDKALYKAVVAWQEKYAADVLTPWGIKKGTGYIYTQSLKKIKQLHEAKCPITAPAAPSISAAVPVKSAPPLATFKRTLKQGDTGADVKALQIFLNAHGYVIAAKGAGSPGKETTTFGSNVTAALKKFQQDNADTLLKPFGLVKPTGNFGTATLKFVTGMLAP